MPIQSIDNLYLSASDKEAVWAGNNPSVDEVESYLSERTFVVSRPPIGNYAYFFSKDHRLYEWHGIAVFKGKWYVERRIAPMFYGKRFTLLVLSQFCKIFTEQPESNQDNCIIVRRLAGMFYGNLSIANGDTLNLANTGRGYLPMPTTTISVDSLSGTLTP